MKHLKKLFAAALMLFVAFAISVPAFAAGEYTITVKNENENSSINGKEYKAYKVFDLTLGDATTENGSTTYGAYAYSIKNTDWAFSTLTAGATTTDGVITTKYGIVLTPSASDPTQYVVDGKTMTEANARALANALAKAGLPTTADGTATGASEQAVIALDEPGYYAVYGVVVPKDPYEEPAEEVVAALALTTTDPAAEVNPKAEVPTLDKKITGEHVLDEEGKAATAQVGTTVSFEIDSNVPDITGYSDYTFIITDTMSSGLTFTDPEGDATNDIVVKINDVDKTSNVNVAVSGQTFTVTIPFSVLSAAVKGQSIVVTYSAVVNQSALTTNYEKNTAKLEYSNNPTTDDTNETPEKEVYVIDVDINVDKVAKSANGNKLSGAEFIVFKGSTKPADSALAWYKWDSTKNEVTWVAKADADKFVTNASGKFNPSVRGLEAEKTGTTYGLIETVAPKGYNPLKDPIFVTLTSSYDKTNKQATVSATGATVTNGTVNLSADATNAQPEAVAQVINQSGSELPSTGGIGTKLFYIVGSMLVIGGGIALITKQRMSKIEG